VVSGIAKQKRWAYLLIKEQIMPTGYTEDVAKGISFNDFIMGCARAMTPCLSMRDEPHNAKIPQEFKPNKWNSEKLKEAMVKLQRLKKMSEAEIDEAARLEHIDAVAKQQARLKEIKELRKKYQTMLSDVERWIPPSDRHEGLKSFMVNQLHDSIDADCGTSYLKSPKPLSGQKWFDRHMKKVLWDIDHYTTMDKEEAERISYNNLWIKELRHSLNDYDYDTDAHENRR